MFFDAFKKSSFKTLESFYLEQNHTDILSKYPWMALAVNERSVAGSILTKELVLTGKTKNLGISFQLAEIESGIVHHVFNGPKKIFSGEIKHDLEIKNTRMLFNNVLDALIEREIKNFTEGMKQSELSPRQLEAEDKALEWLKVSFEMLTKAILESLTNPDFLFQTTFFAGLNPKTGMQEMRLITFNLDMTFLLLPDRNLRVLVYNKKPGEELKDLKPALTGDYSLRKREIFDQFIHLLSVVSKGLHA